MAARTNADVLGKDIILPVEIYSGPFPGKLHGVVCTVTGDADRNCVLYDSIVTVYGAGPRAEGQEGRCTTYVYRSLQLN